MSPGPHSLAGLLAHVDTRLSLGHTHPQVEVTVGWAGQEEMVKSPVVVPGLCASRFEPLADSPGLGTPKSVVRWGTGGSLSKLSVVERHCSHPHWISSHFGPVQFRGASAMTAQ